MPSHGAPSNRAFGLAFAAVFAVVAAVAWLWAGAALWWAAALAAAFLASALAAPWVLLPLNRAWAWLGRRLGRVSNALLLGLFFGLVVLPAGALMRLLGRDPMARRRDAAAQSYWTPVTRRSTAENLSDLF